MHTQTAAPMPIESGEPTVPTGSGGPTIEVTNMLAALLILGGILTIVGYLIAGVSLMGVEVYGSHPLTEIGIGTIAVGLVQSLIFFGLAKIIALLEKSKPNSAVSV